MAQKALLMVDVQNDFCPGGALAVTGGDEVVRPLNRMAAYARKNGWLILASRDWHPAVTSHFKDYGGIWPMHCVQGTHGAAFHSNLDIAGAIIISKATQSDEDGYSAFDGRTERGEWLVDYLKLHRIDEIVVGGLATDYCVKDSAIDARRHGFKTTLLLDACKAVNLNPTDGSDALKRMDATGILFAYSWDIVNL